MQYIIDTAMIFDIPIGIQQILSVCDIDLEPMYIGKSGDADFLLAAPCDAKQAKLSGHSNDKMPSDKAGCSGNQNPR
jgi:hypothetical protein